MQEARFRGQAAGSTGSATPLKPKAVPLPSPVEAHLKLEPGYPWTRAELHTIMAQIRMTLPGVNDDLLGIIVARQLTYIRRFCRQPKAGKGVEKFHDITFKIERTIDYIRSPVGSAAHTATQLCFVRFFGFRQDVIDRVRNDGSKEKAYFCYLQDRMKWAGGEGNTSGWFVRMVQWCIFKRAKCEDTDADIASGTELDVDLHGSSFRRSE